MHLRNPGHIDQALRTVSRLATDCGNCESAYTDFSRAQKAYLDWVDDADGQLRSIFKDAEPADGVTTQAFWEIRRLSETAPGAWQVLRRELRIQAGRMQAIQRRLGELATFLGQPGDIVVLDTSALVEGEWFQDFDWSSRLGLGSPVRIVVPILVVEELDRIKDRDRHRRAGDRASRVLRRLRDLDAEQKGSPAPIRNDVTIEVLVDDDWHQRLPNNDGEIIQQAKLLETMTNRPVTLVCADAAMEFRARRHGLTVAAIPRPNEHRSAGDA